MGGGGYVGTMGHEIWYRHTILQKNGRKKIQNCSYRDDDVTNYINSFLKFRRKMAKICFFPKNNLVTARKKVFKIFFQLLKVQITYKLNMYRLIC